MEAAHKEAIEKAVAARDAAEAQVKEERALRDRMLQAAAAGQLPGQAADGDDAATPGASLQHQSACRCVRKQGQT